MIRRREAESKNLLDAVPERAGHLSTEDNENGHVTLVIPRDSLLDRLVRLVRRTPKQARIELDGLGSTVWRSVDGRRTVADIGEIVKREHGESAEPLYERLAEFVRILNRNKLIELRL